MEIHKTIYRDSLATNWGFRLQGGTDFRQNLVVQRIFERHTFGYPSANSDLGILGLRNSRHKPDTPVFTGSPAEGELQRGDVILGIEHHDATSLTHKQAQDIIKNLGGKISLVIRRYHTQQPATSSPASPRIPVYYQPLPTSHQPLSPYRSRPSEVTPERKMPAPGNYGYVPPNRPHSQEFGVDYRRTAVAQSVPSAYGGPAAGAVSRPHPQQNRHSSEGGMLNRVQNSLAGITLGSHNPQDHYHDDNYNFQLPVSQRKGTFNSQAASPMPYRRRAGTVGGLTASLGDLHHVSAPGEASSASSRIHGRPKLPRNIVQSASQKFEDKISDEQKRKKWDYAAGKQYQPRVQHVFKKPEGSLARAPEFGWSPSAAAYRAAGVKPPGGQHDHVHQGGANSTVEVPDTPAWLGTLASHNAPHRGTFEERLVAGLEPPHAHKPVKEMGWYPGQQQPSNEVQPANPSQYLAEGENANEDDTARIAHLQYNTPIGLYSTDNVANSLHTQTHGRPGEGTMRVVGGPGPTLKNFSDSATYRLIHEQENQNRKWESGRFQQTPGMQPIYPGQPMSAFTNPQQIPAAESVPSGQQHGGHQHEIDHHHGGGDHMTSSRLAYDEDVGASEF